MTELSPAAQAVLDAIKSELDHAPWDLSFIAGSSAAAALRAAAEELHYKEQLGWTGYGYYTDFQNQILAIAAELEAS